MEGDHTHHHSNNNDGLSSMVMMMPFMNSSSVGETSNNNNNNMNKNINRFLMNSNYQASCVDHDQTSQRVTPTGVFMPTHDQNRDFINVAAGFLERSQNPNLDNNNNNNTNMRAKIMAHPHFPRLLAAYVNCQKVGAPPEMVAKLEEASVASQAAIGRSTTLSGFTGEDPSLDQFMEAYCEMLAKYEQELTKPFKEAMHFLSRMESQFKALTLSSSSASTSDFGGRSGSSEEEVDVQGNQIDPQAEDKELKGQLLRKYSGYLGSLRQEFMKKKKKGKLPKEARQQLLEWWNRHYKWPYPSESQKLALAESTGLDQKQINNWFINQRKRHWKPSEDMEFVLMDAAAYPQYYMDTVMGNSSFPMDCAPSHFP
ncbi:hypothetical protein ACFE04_031321 [Oxalis oulophora]